MSNLLDLLAPDHELILRCLLEPTPPSGVYWAIIDDHGPVRAHFEPGVLTIYAKPRNIPILRPSNRTRKQLRPVATGTLGWDLHRSIHTLTLAAADART